MAEYALIKTSNNSLQKLAESDKEFPNGPPDLSQKGLLWMLVQRDARPTFDPATQVIEKADGVSAGKYVFGWTVRNKTQAELDKDASDQAANLDARVTFAIEDVVGKALFKIINEIRTLQSQSQLTPAQFKTWFKNQQT